MKTTRTYLNGIIIGIIAEYCLRFGGGYLQGIILTLLITKMIIEIYQEDL